MATATAESKSHKKISEDLTQILADTYLLLLKTQNYHWNVVDPRFAQLHKLFEKQYEELFEQVDEIAERIRAIGGKTQASMRHFLQITSLDEANAHYSGDEMIRDLAQDRQILSGSLKSRIKETQDAGDEGTADLYIQLVKSHDKAAWMLQSHL
jgi:starvation-inducible DNA-binding protein